MGLTNNPLNLWRPPAASVSGLLPQAVTSIMDLSALQQQGVSLLPSPTEAARVDGKIQGQLKRPPPDSPEENAPSSPKRQRQEEGPIKRPIFPVKLMQAMVHYGNNPIYGDDPPFLWHSDGCSFLVLRQDVFCQFLQDYDLADQYVKYSSVVRKLNRWL